MEKKIIWLMLFVGSTLGSFVPLLWGESAFSISSIVFTTLGGFLGIWIGFKINQ